MLVEVTSEKECILRSEYHLLDSSLVKLTHSLDPLFTSVHIQFPYNGIFGVWSRETQSLSCKVDELLRLGDSLALVTLGRVPNFSRPLN